MKNMKILAAASTNKAYKEKRKLEKHVKKSASVLKKGFEFQKKTRENQIKAQKLTLPTRIEKIRSKKIIPKKIVSEKIIKKITKKRVSVFPNLAKIKNKALKEVQLYAKLKRTERSDDGSLVIFLVDQKTWVPFSGGVHAGHCYPQKNFPHLAFDLYNIWPISQEMNSLQADRVGEWKCNLPVEYQSYLQSKSVDSFAKNCLRNHMYYHSQYEMYSLLNEQEYARLNISKK